MIVKQMNLTYGVLQFHDIDAIGGCSTSKGLNSEFRTVIELPGDTHRARVGREVDSHFSRLSSDESVQGRRFLWLRRD